MRHAAQTLDSRRPMEACAVFCIECDIRILLKNTNKKPRMIGTNPRLRSEYIKLFNEKIDVRIREERDNELEIVIPGPVDTPYKRGRFKIYIKLPPEYPYKSPSVGFGTRIFHPNIDEKSGSVCLDVLNQYWSPLFDCTNVVQSFIPLLLRYPNASDPLNPDAASVLLKSKEKFEEVVERHVAEYAMDHKADAYRDEVVSSSVDSDSLEI